MDDKNLKKLYKAYVDIGEKTTKKLALKSKMSSYLKKTGSDWTTFVKDQKLSGPSENASKATQDAVKSKANAVVPHKKAGQATIHQNQVKGKEVVSKSAKPMGKDLVPTNPNGTQFKTEIDGKTKLGSEKTGSKAFKKSFNKAADEAAFKASKKVGKESAKTTAKKLAKKVVSGTLSGVGKVIGAASVLESNAVGAKEGSLQRKLEDGTQLSDEEHQRLKEDPNAMVQEEVAAPEQTEEQIAQIEHSNKVQELMRNFNMSEEKAERHIVDNKKQEEENAQIAVQDEQAAEYNKNIKLDEEVKNLEEHIAYIESNGGNASTSIAKLEALKQQRSESELQPFPTEHLVGAANSEQPAQNYASVEDRDQQTDALINEASEVDSHQAALDRIKNEQNEAKAQVEAREKERSTWQQELNAQKLAIKSARDKYEKADANLKKGDNQTFWGSKSLPQKIFAGIALFLGAAGQGGNKAVPVLQKQIEAFAQGKAQDEKHNILLRKNAYERVNMELGQMQKMIDNKVKFDQIEILKAANDAKVAKLEKEYANIEKRSYLRDTLTKGGRKLEELTPEERNLLGQDVFKQGKVLRNEYSKETEKLNTRELINNYRIVMSMSKGETSGKTDIALLTKFMNSIDPGSVVREAEYMLAKKASPMARRMANWGNMMINGEMHEDDRKEFAAAVRKLLKPKLRTQNEVNDRYNNLSRQSNVPSSLVVEDFSLEKVAPRAHKIDKKYKQFKGKYTRERIEKAMETVNAFKSTGE